MAKMNANQINKIREMAKKNNVRIDSYYIKDTGKYIKDIPDLSYISVDHVVIRGEKISPFTASTIGEFKERLDKQLKIKKNLSAEVMQKREITTLKRLLRDYESHMITNLAEKTKDVVKAIDTIREAIATIKRNL